MRRANLLWPPRTPGRDLQKEGEPPITSLLEGLRRPADKGSPADSRRGSPPDDRLSACKCRSYPAVRSSGQTTVRLLFQYSIIFFDAGKHHEPICPPSRLEINLISCAIICYRRGRRFRTSDIGKYPTFSTDRFLRNSWTFLGFPTQVRPNLSPLPVNLEVVGHGQCLTAPGRCGYPLGDRS